jgi:hypothetical protein
VADFANYLFRKHVRAAVDERVARRTANRWLVERVGNMVMADQPPGTGHGRTDGVLLEGSWTGHFMMIGRNILYGMALVVSVTAAEAVSSP